jgi:hypothetical protein
MKVYLQVNEKAYGKGCVTGMNRESGKIAEHC